MSFAKTLYCLISQGKMGILGERFLAVFTELNHKVFHNSLSADCATEQLYFPETQMAHNSAL